MPFDMPALAGHGRRLSAAFLDAVAYLVVVGAFTAGGLGVGIAIASSTSDGSDDGWEALGLALVCGLFGIVIGLLCWLVLIVWLVRRPGGRNGQTLGKQMVGIRAARVDGAPLTVGPALLREVLAKGVMVGVTSSLVSGLLGFADIGLLGLVVAILAWYGPAFFDDERRTLHDRMLDTRVIDAKHGVAPAPSSEELWPATP